MALLAILLALLFMGFLTVLYMGGGVAALGIPPGVSPFQRIAQTRSSVCEINRKTLSAELVLGDFGTARSPDPQRLQQVFGSRRTCPGEGKCYYADNEIHCTQHTPTPRFRDALMGN